MKTNMYNYGRLFSSVKQKDLKLRLVQNEVTIIKSKSALLEIKEWNELDCEIFEKFDFVKKSGVLKN